MKYYTYKKHFLKAGDFEIERGLKLGEPMIVRMPGCLWMGLFSGVEFVDTIPDDTIGRYYVECDKHGNKI